uniref:Uncharacterized protein n=1 Tax=Arundo donax TaxID=35708 RepID=A0A0A8Y6A3_ARUDO
MYYRKILEYSQ